MVYLGILIWNWFEAIIKKKSLLFPVLGLLYLAWLGGAADPITTMDYANYESNYNLMFSPTYNSRFEWAYLSLAKASYLAGLSYAQFRLILVFLIFIVLFIVVKKFTYNMGFFVATFALFPFFNEITQIRSFAMYTLVLFAASLLINVNKRNVIIAILIILLSTGFHSSGYFYFIFLLIRILVKKNINVGSVIIIISLLGSAFLILTGSTSIGLHIAKVVGYVTGNTASTENILINFVGTSVRRAFVLEVIFLYGVVFVLSKKMIEYLSTKVIFDKNIIGKTEVLISLIYTGMLGLPLLAMSDQYQRFPRFGIETAIILAALYFEHRIKISQRIGGMLSTLLIISFLSYVFYGLPNSTFAQSIPFLAHWKFSN